MYKSTFDSCKTLSQFSRYASVSNPITLSYLNWGTLQALPYTLWTGDPKAQIPKPASSTAANGLSQAFLNCSASKTRESSASVATV